MIYKGKHINKNNYTFTRETSVLYLMEIQLGLSTNNLAQDLAKKEQKHLWTFFLIQHNS